MSDEKNILVLRHNLLTTNFTNYTNSYIFSLPSYILPLPSSLIVSSLGVLEASSLISIVPLKGD